MNTSSGSTKNGKHTTDHDLQCIYELNPEDLKSLFNFSVLDSRSKAKIKLFTLKQINQTLT